MRVIAHFGAHKTGTSLVQKFMRDRPQLMARNRIATIGRTETGHMIGWGSERQVKGDDLASALDRAARATRYFVISHENSLDRPFMRGQAGLYPQAHQNAARIRACLGGRPAQAVYYIRSQPAFIESYYLQMIHEGAWHSFDEWFAGLAETDLSWRPLRDALTSVFGEENVILRSFEDDMGAGQARYLAGFFGSFSNIGPAQMDAFDYAPLRNPSIGDRGLEIALAANRYLTRPAERKKMRKFLQLEFSNRDYQRPQLLSDTVRDEMKACYHKENEALVRESAAATARWREG